MSTQMGNADRQIGAGIAAAPYDALFTDLYELTILQTYFAQGMEDQAVFSLFVRRLPERRNYLLACGLDTVLEYLEHLRFTSDDIAYLRSLGQFSDAFLERLQNFRFSGEVHAVPEGTPVFANEPILKIVAPIAEAQLVETFVMNQVHLQTVLASKAARVAAAAQGRAVVDFGPRRMHGVDAAIKAARAFHIAGVSATSNVLAGKIYGVPVSGTMAHSLVQSFDDELDASRAFAGLYPETVLLVDTYDTLGGVEKVIDLARELGADFKVRAVRLDSGDLADLARRAGSWTKPACIRSRSSPAAACTRMRSPGFSPRERRSPGSASALGWASHPTRRISTSPTSSAPTPAGAGSSCRPASPCSLAANKSSGRSWAARH
jgi:putative nicotinate phosphoribosyltransferase